MLAVQAQHFDQLLCEHTPHNRRSVLIPQAFSVLHGVSSLYLKLFKRGMITVVWLKSMRSVHLTVNRETLHSKYISILASIMGESINMYAHSSSPRHSLIVQLPLDGHFPTC